MNEDEHTTGKDDASGRVGYVGFIDWLDGKLVPVFGPKSLGPYETVIRQVSDALCPVCGRPISEHSIDHSTPNTILHCPVAHIPVPVDNKPVNELGMHKPANDQ